MNIVCLLRTRAKRAMLNVLSLARCAAAHLGADEDREALNEVELLREELDLLRSRLRRVSARRRTFYTPTERMRVLELRALRGWCWAETAERLLVTKATLSRWTNRCDEGSLARTRSPINRLPDFVRHAVQRLKVFCPRLGKGKIAEVLCRAGIEISATSVKRILGEPGFPGPAPKPEAVPGPRPPRRGNDEVWHIDATVVPTLGSGLWVPWRPGTVELKWPYCWWVAAVLDSGSRRCHGVGVFKKRPTAMELRDLLDRAMEESGRSPRILISDREGQFTSNIIAEWTTDNDVDHRFGAVGKKGSIAVIERFFLTLKNECTRRLLVAFRESSFRRELDAYLSWYKRASPALGNRWEVAQRCLFRPRYRGHQKDWGYHHRGLRQAAEPTDRSSRRVERPSC